MTSFERLWTLFRSDPRHYQILVLLSLLLYGVCWLQFEISLDQIVILLGGAVLTQCICTRLRRLPTFDLRKSAHLAMPAAADQQYSTFGRYRHRDNP